MTTAFRRIQAGLETVRGTGVAADKVMLGTMTMTPTVIHHRPVDERNSLAEFQRSIAVAQSTRLRFEGDATYEQLIDWLSMSVIGAVAPATVEVTGRVWTFTPNTTSKNVQDSYTFEYGDDIQAWDSAFSIIENLELSIALDEVIQIRADMFARFAAKTTFTGALSADAVINEIVANQMKVYIDGTYANLGVTEVPTLVAGATVRLPTGITPAKYADGNLDHNAVSESKTHLELDLDLIVSTEMVTEYDAFVAGTDRAVRLEITGPIAVGATNYKLTIDCFGRYVAPPELFGERDGEDMVRLQLHSHEDVSGNHFEFAVTNLITAI